MKFDLDTAAEQRGTGSAKLYQLIRESGAGGGQILLTALDGAKQGQKALAAGGEILWESCPDNIFRPNRERLAGLSGNGVVRIGETSVFYERLGRQPRLVICGAGHVSIPVIQIGRMAGFDVTVLEDRPQFADNARRAGASRVICESFERGLEEIRGDEDTYFVIVTRGHRCDELCLARIAGKPHAYIGMMGSRRRVAMVKEHLRGAGVGEEILAQLHAPIGLDIGAETPEEIAVSIMAEIIRERRLCGRLCGFSPELLRGISELGENGGVLATIVGKKGSAPRETGAKMLVLPDGRTVDTIGGGCAEAEIIRKALHLLRTEGASCELCRVDMTAGEAELEGMVCGGTADIFLEKIGG